MDSSRSCKRAARSDELAKGLCGEADGGGFEKTIESGVLWKAPVKISAVA